MKALLLLLFSSLNCSNIFSQTCSQLKNGIYDIEYDSAFKKYPKCRFEIINDICYVTEKGERKKYDVIKPSQCNFWLYDSVVIDESKLTELQKALRKQTPFYEIFKVEGNSYYFVFRVDAHVRINTGKFIQVDK